MVTQFGLDWLIAVTKPDRSYSIKKICDILPSAFEAFALQPDRHIRPTTDYCQAQN